MSEIKIFESAQFGTVRTVMRDGEPWFVAADVCKSLELDQPHKAIARLDEDEVSRGIEIPHPQSTNKTIEVSVVNEPGLYALVLGSRKPEARVTCAQGCLTVL